jgi:ACS family D-galactonate transporter-like MFS transporter
MGNTTVAAATRGPSFGLVLMIGIAIMLNYIDRGAVSIAAPLIKDEMGLSATGYGLVVSAFFWTYVPFLLLAGWLADKVSVHRLMAGGVAVWALSTLAMGFAGGLVSLVIFRLLMGVGEGVAFPSASKLLARSPDHKRNSANVALSAGLAMGPLVGTLAGGAIMELWGWRPMFLIFGGVTLLWLIPWARLKSEVDQPMAHDDEGACPYPKLLRCRQLWAMCFYHFSGTYALYFIIAWLPLYLVKVRGYDIADMALLTALFYGGQTIGAAGSAAAADRLIARGVESARVRRVVGLVCSAFSVVGILAIGQTETTASLIAWLVPTSLCFGTITGILFTVGQTLAGPASAGRWVGVQSSFGNLAGITGPVITGAIVDSVGYGPTFALTAGIVAFGALSFAIGVPKLAPLEWKARGVV